MQNKILTAFNLQRRKIQSFNDFHCKKKKTLLKHNICCMHNITHIPAGSLPQMPLVWKTQQRNISLRANKHIFVKWIIFFHGFRGSHSKWQKTCLLIIFQSDSWEKKTELLFSNWCTRYLHTAEGSERIIMQPVLHSVKLCLYILISFHPAHTFHPAPSKHPKIAFTFYSCAT